MEQLDSLHAAALEAAVEAFGKQVGGQEALGRRDWIGA